MADLSVQTITRSGLGPSMSAASAGGDRAPNDGRTTFLFIKNANVSVARTVTLDIQQTLDGQPVTDPTVQVPASGERMIGPFPKTVYDDVDDMVNVSYDSEADLTIAALKMGT